jgi:hypothetical protein
VTRIVAAVIAVALIVGALVYRNRLDEEERRGPYKLTCATELAEACRSLADVEVTIEPAGVTADRLLADTNPSFEGWLAAGPWAETAGDVIKTRRVVAHTQVAVAIWKERAAALRRVCPPLNAKCFGDAAARGDWAANRGNAAWGPVKFAYADPGTESGGLAALAAGTSGVIGSLDIVPAALEANDEYLNWLGGFAKARVAQGLGTILAVGPAIADAYIGLEAEITPALAQAARRNELEVVYLAPVDIEAKLASPAGARPAPEGLSEALLAGGWRANKQPATAARPSSGGWAGLRRLWQSLR